MDIDSTLLCTIMDPAVEPAEIVRALYKAAESQRKAETFHSGDRYLAAALAEIKSALHSTATLLAFDRCYLAEAADDGFEALLGTLHSFIGAAQTAATRLGTLVKPDLERVDWRFVDVTRGPDHIAPSRKARSARKARRSKPTVVPEPLFDRMPSVKGK